MRLDAMFVLEDVAVERMIKLTPKQRFNYILGVDGSDYFEKHLIDMTDFIIYPPKAYQLLQKIVMNFDELINNNLEKLYEDENYSLYALTHEQVSQLNTKLSNKNWSDIINEFIKINEFKLSKNSQEELLEHCHYLTRLTKKALDTHIKTIVSFSHGNN